MILTVDVGNSEIAFGGFSGNELRFMARITTQPQITDDEYAMRLEGMLRLHGIQKEDITGAIISSVVPQLNRTLKRAIRFLIGVEPAFSMRNGNRLDRSDRNAGQPRRQV